MSYTFYDYLDLPQGAAPALIESAYLRLLERFGYGTSDAGQDLSGLVAMIHSAYTVLSNPDERVRYDANLAREAAMADAELKATLDQSEFCMWQSVQDPPAWPGDALSAIAA